jgi:hypothetical protein
LVPLEVGILASSALEWAIQLNFWAFLSNMAYIRLIVHLFVGKLVVAKLAAFKLKSIELIKYLSRNTGLYKDLLAHWTRYRRHIYLETHFS